MLSIVVPEFMDSVPVTVDIKIIEVNLWFLAIKALLNETSLHQFDNLVTDGFQLAPKEFRIKTHSHS